MWGLKYTNTHFFLFCYSERSEAEGRTESQELGWENENEEKNKKNDGQGPPKDASSQRH